MTFLLLMSGRSFLREAICSFLRSEMGGVEIVLIERADQVSAAQTQQKGGIQLVQIYIDQRAADEASVLEDVELVRAALPGTPIVLLGDRSDAEQAASALRIGAQGYIPAATPAEIIKHALPLIAVGGLFAPPFLYNGSSRVVSPPIPHGYLAPVAHVKPPQLPVLIEVEGVDDLLLTEREIEVLKLLGAGLQNKLIAYHLGVKEGTVKVHMRSIMKKLNVTCRTQAALIAQSRFRLEADASSGGCSDQSSSHPELAKKLVHSV